MIKVAIGFAALYGCVLLLLFIFQRKLLYLPNPIKPSIEQAAMRHVAHWPTYENHLGFIRKPVGSAQGTIIVFHGNAGTALDRTYYTDALAARGFRVILAEYPGYGGRSGVPTETTIVESTRDIIERTYTAYGEPTYLWGESLGAGVVVAALYQTGTPINGVVLLTPWDTLPAVAQQHYWYLPAKWLMKDQYNSLKNIQGFDGSVAVLVAAHDQIIPMEHGNRLFEQLGGKKKYWVFDDADHNTWPHEQEADWWDEIITFLKE